MKKIIIIGSGIGGSGIGALISKETPHEVTLFEKNNMIGGRCASYKKKDDEGREWIFDVGCHIISTCHKGPLGEILYRCDKTDAVKWIHTGLRSNVFGVMLHGKKKRSKRRVRKEPEPSKPKKQSIFDYLNTMPIEETFKYDDISLKTFLDNYQDTTGTNVNSLVFSMSAYIYFGTDLQATAAGEYIRCFSWQNRAKSMGYPLGGPGIITETYCDVIKENGGNIFIGKEGQIKKIIVENNEVKGVNVGPNNDFYEADIVIANSDIKATVFNLVGDKYFSREYINYIKSLKFGGQGCSLKLGINKIIMPDKMLMYIPKVPSAEGKPLNKIDIHDIFFKDQEIPEKIPMLIVPISNFDPSFAPEGCQNLHCVAVTKLNGTKEWSESEEKKWEKTCLDTFLSLWPDLEEYIIIKEFIGPRTIASKYGKEGAGVGIGQIVGQVGKSRPNLISPIKGLYYCSGDAGGWGIGTELPGRAVLELFDLFKNNDFSNEKLILKKD